MIERIKNLNMGAKFIGAICIVLLVLTVLDITYNANKEREISEKAIVRWATIMGDAVRISLNNLMREGKMDSRFSLFDRLSAELSELKSIRVIRGERTDEIFREVERRDIIPSLHRKSVRYIKDIADIEQSLKATKDRDEREDLQASILELRRELQSIEDELKELQKPREVEERERPADALEEEVLRTGEPFYEFSGNNGRAIIPYIVQEKGCSATTGCHKYAKEGDVLGAINLEFTLDKINAEIEQNNLKMVGFWVMRFFIFLAVISFLLTMIVTRNIKNMLGLFKKISEGDMSARATDFYNDEIGQLAAGFNQMAEELDKTTVSKSYVDDIIKNMINILIVASPEGKIVRLNDPVCRLLGYEEKELVGLPTDSILRLNDSISETLSTAGKINNVEALLLSKSKSAIPVMLSGSLMYNASKKITGLIYIAKDLTEQKESLEKVRKLSSYDELTGLLKRTLLITVIDECLLRARDAGEQGALLIIDVDDFLIINNTYGHKMADEFLKHVAKLLTLAISDFTQLQGESKTGNVSTSRLAADEFAIILPNTGEADAKNLAEMIRTRVEGSRNPLFNKNKETVSIGIALYPTHGATASDLLTRADTAMFRAKELGGNRIYTFSPESGDFDVFHTRKKWKERIHKALDDDALEVWFQPIMELRSGNIGHYEALVRMRNGDGSITAPAEFIESAERYKLIEAIDKVVLEKILLTQKKNRGEGGQLSFSINLSGKNIENEEFLSFLKEKLLSKEVKAENLIFEITETEAIHDLDKAKHFIASLKSFGCKFSLDDFGVGFTSFHYLREMDVDYIKIDGCFINKLHENITDQLFVRAIVDIAKGLNIKVVAEFVESEEILTVLNEIGVDYAQGYFIGRPDPEFVKTVH